jgi:hypothetical protein
LRFVYLELLHLLLQRRNLLSQPALDGSKFKAVNNRDKNFTPAKMRRMRPRSRQISRLNPRIRACRTARLYPSRRY